VSYVQSVLQPGERILAISKLHWIACRYAIASLVLGVVAVSLEYRPLQGRKYADQTVWITFIHICGGVRLVLRQGLARPLADRDCGYRKTHQLLSYGDVVVKGKGATFEPLNDVANPIALGNAITAE
jgi:hypothetical protein